MKPDLNYQANIKREADKYHESLKGNPTGYITCLVGKNRQTTFDRDLELFKRNFRGETVRQLTSNQMTEEFNQLIFENHVLKYNNFKPLWELFVTGVVIKNVQAVSNDQFIYEVGDFDIIGWVENQISTKDLFTT